MGLKGCEGILRINIIHSPIKIYSEIDDRVSLTKKGKYVPIDNATNGDTIPKHAIGWDSYSSKT